MRRFAAGSALALALLAAASPLGPASAHTTVPVLGTIESERCVGYDFLAFLPTPLVRPHVPAGYEPYYLFISVNGHYPPVSNVYLNVFSCEEVTVGSVTESNVTIAHVGTATDLGTYRWETFVDEPSPNAVQGLLEDCGWPVLEATFTETGTGVRIEADGIRYTLTTNPEPVGHETRTDTFPHAVHHETADGAHLQQDEVFNEGTVALYPSVLQAEGGIWEAILGAPSVPLAGIVQEVDTVWASDVHEPEE